MVKKKTISNEEPTNSREEWLRTYGQIIGNGMIGFVLILLLINSYQISSKIEETHQIVSKLQIQFDKLPKSSVEECSQFQKPEPIEKENEEITEKLSETIEEVKPILTKEEVKNEEIPKKDLLYKTNAASYMLGASVDTSYSSSSDLSGESDLVLLDRPNPPANRAWCSDEKEPVLTVNLVNYIKPTAVSYQHFKWNETVPHGSPRVFNVFACLDFYCEKTELLISNCEYKSSGQIQEQICQIPSNTKTKSIGKVQFRFLKNHGNVKKTCVSLVRVYGESTELPKMRNYEEEFRQRRKRCGGGAKTCSELRDSFHNNPFLYEKFFFKHCGYLFSNGCCSVCPECCDECYIGDDTDYYWIAAFFLILLVGGFVFIIFIYLYEIVKESYREYRLTRNRRQHWH
uniref:SUN domain-containing protein n=1 Tax=Caenorhabditis tropicalis TaxID=1561998 RepID=A0A1I7UDA8_9PELO